MKHAISCLVLFVNCLTIAIAAEPVLKPDFQSSYLALGFAPSTPAFSWFGVDSLGGGQGLENVVLNTGLTTNNCRLIKDKPDQYRYVQPSSDGHSLEIWKIRIYGSQLILRSDFNPATKAPPFLLVVDQRKNHATLLGNMIPGERQMAIPCVLHLPDKGTFRITSNQKGAALGYDARRRQPENFVSITFPAATKIQPTVEYTLDVTAIYPHLEGLDDNPLYAGYRRNFLNLLQFQPRLRTLANNSSSDVCGFCFWEYSELALQTPPLAPALTALDLVRQSLDRVLNGGLTYGQAGYKQTPEYPEAALWSPPFDSLDTLPSLLIASCQYIAGSHDTNWANAHFKQLAGMGRTMLAQDKNGDGLIKYVLSGNSGSWAGKGNRVRPANWWDTIGFGYEDAYSNALAYRACKLMGQTARDLGRNGEADVFFAAAEKIKKSYYPTFYDPQTGVLAGWRSADGKLHDYWFTFINGMAISFGLVDDSKANAIMDRLLEKMNAVGFNRFELGLPGNLIPIRKEDYIEGPKRYGSPSLEDGSDGFQIYENGGATPCHAYWTIKAFYHLGRVADARRIYYPMLQSFAKGSFQGFGPDKKSRDWSDWQGNGNGYEGYLSDGYLALLAVADDLKAPAMVEHGK